MGSGAKQLLPLACCRKQGTGALCVVPAGGTWSLPSDWDL